MDGRSSWNHDRLFVGVHVLPRKVPVLDPDQRDLVAFERHCPRFEFLANVMGVRGHAVDFHRLGSREGFADDVVGVPWIDIDARAQAVPWRKLERDPRASRSLVREVQRDCGPLGLFLTRRMEVRFEHEVAARRETDRCIFGEDPRIASYGPAAEADASSDRIAPHAAVSRFRILGV